LPQARLETFRWVEDLFEPSEARQVAAATNPTPSANLAAGDVPVLNGEDYL
jgi:hypothetical protein